MQLENAEILGKADLSITLKDSLYHGTLVFFRKQSKKGNAADGFIFANSCTKERRDF